MTEYELTCILRERYEMAKRNETILQVDLFGIDYADVIRQNHYSVKKIVRNAGLKESYVTEVSKGIRLSEYVTRKQEIEKELRNGKKNIRVI